MDADQEQRFRFRMRLEQEQAHESTGNQVMGWAKMPEKMLGATLDVAKEQVPTQFGKGAMNVLSKTMPSNLSPLNLGLMGTVEGISAGLPYLAPAGKAIANQLESASGIASQGEGALTQAFKTPSLLFGKGRQAVSDLYTGAISKVRPQYAKKLGGIVEAEKEAQEARKLAAARDFITGKTPELKMPAAPPSVTGEVEAMREQIRAERFVIKAEKLAKKGMLSPEDALEARKAVDVLEGSKTAVPRRIFELRKTFDESWKATAGGAEADKAYQRAIQSEALRNLLPKNKYGTTSTLKTGIMAALPGVGALLSPIVQGAGAAGLGLGVKGINALARNPALVTLLNSLMRQGQSQQTQPPSSTQ